MQKGEFLKFLMLLLKSGLPLLKSVVKPLGMVGLAAAASAADAAINNKILGSGNHTTLIISNNDMQDLLKIVKSLEDSGILLNGITETVFFLSMLLGTLIASLLGDLLIKNYREEVLYRPIIKMNLDSLVSIVEIIYQIK